MVEKMALSYQALVSKLQVCMPPLGSYALHSVLLQYEQTLFLGSFNCTNRGKRDLQIRRFIFNRFWMETSQKTIFLELHKELSQSLVVYVSLDIQTF